MTDGIDIKTLKPFKTIEYKINGTSLFDIVAATFDTDAQKGVLSKNETRALKKYLAQANQWEDPKKPYGERLKQRDGFLEIDEVRSYATMLNDKSQKLLAKFTDNYKTQQNISKYVDFVNTSSAILKRLGME